jgi:hypothetical protein
LGKISVVIFDINDINNAVKTGKKIPFINILLFYHQKHLPMFF